MGTFIVKLMKLSILPVALLSACVEYEATNFVGFDNGAQVYRVTLAYDALQSSRTQQNGFKAQIKPYCPNGYREISRTEPVLVNQNSGGFYGTAYVAPSQTMHIDMTFACVGAPAVQEVQ